MTARRRDQRGITLFGLMFWAIVVGFVALVVMRVLPTMNEYFTIQKAVKKVALEGGGTVPEIRAQRVRVVAREAPHHLLRGQAQIVTPRVVREVFGLSHVANVWGQCPPDPLQESRDRMIDHGPPRTARTSSLAASPRTRTRLPTTTLSNDTSHAAVGSMEKVLDDK